MVEETIWEDLGISVLVEPLIEIDFVETQSILPYQCANGKIGLSPNGKEIAYGYLIYEIFLQLSSMQHGYYQMICMILQYSSKRSCIYGENI